MSKLVFESLNEVISFERSKDPLKTLGIGQTDLIKKWLDKYQIWSQHEIKNDFSINILEYGVDIRSCDLEEFPSYIQFNRINGFFNCAHNNLISLRGCPKYVKLTFLCSGNKIKSLEYSPLYVGEDFYCTQTNNSLKKFTEEDIKKVCEVAGKIHI